MPELYKIFEEIKPNLLVKFNESEIHHHHMDQATSHIKKSLVNQLKKTLAEDKLDDIILIFMGYEYHSSASSHIIYDYTNILVDKLGMDKEKASAWAQEIIPYSLAQIGNRLSYSNFTKIGVINLINSSESNSTGLKRSLRGFFKSLRNKNIPNNLSPLV